MWRNLLPRLGRVIFVYQMPNAVVQPVDCPFERVNLPPLIQQRRIHGTQIALQVHDEQFQGDKAFFSWF